MLENNIKEETPKYFLEFSKDFKEFKKDVDDRFNKVDEKFDKINNKLKDINVRFDNIDKRFDDVEDNLEMHFETIGEIKIQVTQTNLNLRQKASHEYVKEVDERTKKLEKAAFA